MTNVNHIKSGKAFFLAKKTAPSLDYNIKALVALAALVETQLNQSSSWLEVSTLLKCHKIEIYYVAMEKKVGKKKYKSVVKSTSSEKQNGY